MSSHLQSRLGLQGVKTALLFEVLGKEGWSDLSHVADTIKGLPLRVQSARPLAEAISSAGGVDFGALTPELMLQTCPGVFVAGEMLDFDAPTGGYLLQAAFATGRAAGLGAVRYLGLPVRPQQSVGGHHAGFPPRHLPNSLELAASNK